MSTCESHNMPGQKLVVHPSFASRNRYLPSTVVSPGYRSPNAATFASIVRSAAATAAATASASGVGRTSIAVMNVLP